MEHGDAGVLPSETKGHGKEIEARSRRQNIDRAPMADQASAGSSQCGICSEPTGAEYEPLGSGVVVHSCALLLGQLGDEQGGSRVVGVELGIATTE
jgi:hypothetical protein